MKGAATPRRTRQSARNDRAPRPSSRPPRARDAPYATWKVVVLTTLATLLAAVVFVNLMPAEKRVEVQMPRLYGTSDPQFERTMNVLFGPPILAGNRLVTLLNGDEIFPAMLRAIRSARRTIDFENYIYWEGSVGESFAQALMERAQAGVRVHVLLDWIGSIKMSNETFKRMTAAGVDIHRFHEPKWYALGRLNDRTHRKILVIDGRTGFTGGAGIGDKWAGHAQDADHWRDTQVQVEGPVVAQLQAVFMDNWTKATGRVLDGPDYFPQLAAVGESRAHMFESSPTGGSESMHLMFLLAITAAERSILLSTPYFVPDELSTKALVDAVKRGVKVQIIVPGETSDVEIATRASRARWGDLLRAGAEIYEFQPTLYHCKVMVVDSYWVTVGSTNFDIRSFQLNDEANLNVFDRAFAATQTEVFAQDLTRTRRITFEEWSNRPYWEKLLEQAASLLGRQL